MDVAAPTKFGETIATPDNRSLLDGAINRRGTRVSRGRTVQGVYLPSVDENESRFARDTCTTGKPSFDRRGKAGSFRLGNKNLIRCRLIGLIFEPYQRLFESTSTLTLSRCWEQLCAVRTARVTDNQTCKIPVTM